MMKSKFMAGLIATVICLVFVVAAAILVNEMFDGRTADKVIKVVAFATIAIWLGLYAWLKPRLYDGQAKDAAADQNQLTENGEVKQEIKPRQAKEDRHTIR